MDDKKIERKYGTEAAAEPIEIDESKFERIIGPGLDSDSVEVGR